MFRSKTKSRKLQGPPGLVDLASRGSANADRDLPTVAGCGLPTDRSRREIVFEPEPFARVDRQAKLGAPPENIFSGTGPFLANEIVDFALAQPSEAFAQIVNRARAADKRLCTGAVGTVEPARVAVAKEGMTLVKIIDALVDLIVVELAAGKRCRCRPGSADAGKQAGEFLHHGFGEPAEGGDLAAEY